MSSLPRYNPDAGASDHERLSGLIDFLSAYIEQFHGGYARLLEYDGKRAVVEMGGACTGCALAPTTLHGWIEGTVRQFFPDIQEVVGVQGERELP
ncbi:MAG: NifU family protein [Anaerolineae bacterium]|nr:NifU family protein [Anaerolineae bacterium]